MNNCIEDYTFWGLVNHGVEMDTPIDLPPDI
jgi:hypothetical protein